MHLLSKRFSSQLIAILEPVCTHWQTVEIRVATIQQVLIVKAIMLGVYTFRQTPKVSLRLKLWLL